jgi:hypothetical protein
VIVTNQTGDAVELERRHRQHAKVENRIKQLEDIGDARFPFTRFHANLAWLETMLTAALLLAATRHAAPWRHPDRQRPPRRQRPTSPSRVDALPADSRPLLNDRG